MRQGVILLKKQTFWVQPSFIPPLIPFLTVPRTLKKDYDRSACDVLKDDTDAVLNFCFILKVYIRSNNLTISFVFVHLHVCLLNRSARNQYSSFLFLFRECVAQV